MQAVSFQGGFLNPAIRKPVTNAVSKKSPAIEAKLNELFAQRVYYMRRQNNGLALSINSLEAAFESICKDLGVNSKDYSSVFCRYVKFKF